MNKEKIGYWSWWWNKEKRKGNALLWIWLLFIIIDGSIFFPHLLFVGVDNIGFADNVLYTVSAVIMGILLGAAFIYRVGSMFYDVFKDSYEKYKEGIK